MYLKNRRVIRTMIRCRSLLFHPHSGSDILSVLDFGPFRHAGQCGTPINNVTSRLQQLVIAISNLVVSCVLLAAGAAISRGK